MEHQLNACQHPRQIHGLEAAAEPEVYDHLLVQLAPDVCDGNHQHVHEEIQIEYHAAQIGKHSCDEQQIKIVGGAARILILLEACAVLCDEIAVDQEMESGGSAQREHKQRGDTAPQLQPAEDKFPGKVRVFHGQHTEAAEKAQAHCGRYPVAREAGQRVIPRASVHNYFDYVKSLLNNVISFVLY